MTGRNDLRTFDLEERPRPLVMAHRGASGYAPENTLAAFRLALAQGADLLETDLRFTRDGHLVCIHDATVDRTTDAGGPVSERSLAEIRKLDAGSWFGPDFAGERIPTLQELLEMTPEDVGLGLELKDPLFERPEYAQKLVDALPKERFEGRVAILSFEQARLESVKWLAPYLPTGIISLYRLVPFGPNEMIGPLWPLVFLNPLYPWLTHRQGKFICPLDDRPDRRVRWYVFIGCDAVLTNTPDTTIEAIVRATRGCWQPRSLREQ